MTKEEVERRDDEKSDEDERRFSLAGTGKKG